MFQHLILNVCNSTAAKYLTNCMLRSLLSESALSILVSDWEPQEQCLCYVAYVSYCSQCKLLMSKCCVPRHTCVTQSTQLLYHVHSLRVSVLII